MFIAYQGDLAVQYGTDLVDLHNRCLFMQIDSIKEVDYDVCLHEGKITPVSEVEKQEEAEEDNKTESAQDESEV